MGFFRKHKASRYTLEVAKAREFDAQQDVIDAVVDGHSRDNINELMIEWAEWRELLARKQGENESDVH